MSGASEVDRQLREKQTYNLFYSSLTSRASPCLTDHGWRVPIIFGEINDPYADVSVRPDFVLYDGDTCLLVEIKSGNNIRDRDITQMERCNQLTIDGVEEELAAANVQESTPYEGEVQTIDRCIVYHDIDEEWVEKCRNEWESCQKQLERLEQEAAILTQDFGGSLRRVAGEFRSGRLQHRFDNGIELPENPKEEFVLTEQMEKEILAIAICGIWGEQAVGYDNPVEVNVNQIRDHFAPTFNVPPDRVNRVLYYLTEINACNHVEDLTYEFSRNHISEVLSITQTVRNARVEEVLDDVDESRIPDERQTTLNMISDEVMIKGDSEDEEIVGDGEGEQDHMEENTGDEN
jgi:hypothetical protein